MGTREMKYFCVWAGVIKSSCVASHCISDVTHPPLSSLLMASNRERDAGRCLLTSSSYYCRVSVRLWQQVSYTFVSAYGRAAGGGGDSPSWMFAPPNLLLLFVSSSSPRALLNVVRRRYRMCVFEHNHRVWIGVAGVEKGEEGGRVWGFPVAFELSTAVLLAASSSFPCPVSFFFLFRLFFFSVGGWLGSLALVSHVFCYYRIFQLFFFFFFGLRRFKILRFVLGLCVCVCLSLPDYLRWHVTGAALTLTTTPPTAIHLCRVLQTLTRLCYKQFATGAFMFSFCNPLLPISPPPLAKCSRVPFCVTNLSLNDSCRYYVNPPALSAPALYSLTSVSHSTLLLLCVCLRAALFVPFEVWPWKSFFLSSHCDRELFSQSRD